MTCYCFEIKTTFKSGKIIKEYILSLNEETMWKYYDKHHNKKLIEKSIITDAWEA